MARQVDDTQTVEPVASTSTETSIDQDVVRETRPVSGDENLRTTSRIRTEKHNAMLARHGGFSWGADFLGFAVATFFTVVFLAVVGAIIGTVGYQLHAQVPKAGSAVAGTTQSLGIGGVAGSLIALFLAYMIGGYAAARMARFSGRTNGLGVVIWTIVVAIVLGVAGTAVGNSFNLASQIHLKIDTGTLTTAGVISLVVALAIMVLGAWLGGILGERYHRGIDREAEAV